MVQPFCLIDLGMERGDQLSSMLVANNPVGKGTCIFQEVRQYCTCFPSSQVKVLFRFAMA